MFSVLILEDDIIQQNAIKNIIAAGFNNWTITTAADYKSAYELSTNQTFNLFLLDIELPDSAQDGIDFGKRLRTMPQYLHTPTIFLTALPDKVLTAVQDIHCSSYLVKPYTPSQLMTAIGYIIAPNVNVTTVNQITLRDVNGVYRHVSPDDIYYIESIAKNMQVHMTDTIVDIANQSIGKILEELPDYFMQCHRKYVINLHQITAYDKTINLLQIGKYSIPVGRKYKDIIEEELNL